MDRSARLSLLHERDRSLMSQVKTYFQARSLPEIWPRLLQDPAIAEIVALHDPHEKPEVIITYGEMYRRFQQIAAGLQQLGVEVGDRLALFSDNSPRWLLMDQGMMMAGAVNVVRGSQASAEELWYILGNSGSTGLAVQDAKTYEKLRDRLGDFPLKFIIIMSNESVECDLPGVKLLMFNDLVIAGAEASLLQVTLQPDNLATLLYTSGTTGKPKGVMLTHRNLLHQVNTLGTIVYPQAGDRVLSILPTWHSYERACEYFLLGQGCTQVYTNLRYVKSDLKSVKPNFMVAVPRLWESIYEGIQKQFREQPEGKQKLVQRLIDNSLRYTKAKHIWRQMSLENFDPSLVDRLVAGLEALVRWPFHKLGDRLVYNKVRQATGGKLRQVISGGGSLASHLDLFFEVVGIEILVGYGLTETSPVLTARRSYRNLKGSAGQPIDGTEIKIVHPETKQELPVGDRGLVMARGPQVMQGYYQNPEATAKAIDADGWFDTGDLGNLTPQWDVILTGRAKDTIVLTNGENIEPQPIEDACLRSPYIDQIMLVGQDQRSLGALVVPNWEELERWATSQNLVLNLPDQPASSQGLSLEDKMVQDLFRKELTRQVKERTGFRPDERIGPFRLITEPFSMDNGMMTQTLKIRRPVVTDHYQEMIREMFT